MHFFQKIVQAGVNLRVMLIQIISKIDVVKKCQR